MLVVLKYTVKEPDSLGNCTERNHEQWHWYPEKNGQCSREQTLLSEHGVELAAQN